jgi:hypothetical protein
MGRKVDDGQAVDVQAPGATVIDFGELYRIDGFSGIALSAKTAADPDRGLALEISSCIWMVKTPAAVGVTRGAPVFWTSGTGFKKSSTDLANSAGTAGDEPVGKVETVRNTNGYAAIKLFDGGGSTA